MKGLKNRTTYTIFPVFHDSALIGNRGLHLVKVSNFHFIDPSLVCYLLGSKFNSRQGREYHTNKFSERKVTLNGEL